MSVDIPTAQPSSALKISETILKTGRLDAMVSFMASDAFKANPSGTELDPEEFFARRRG